MRRPVVLAILIMLPLALHKSASANSKIKIDAVPLEYTPMNSPTNHEPVSLSGFHFEINQGTGRARVVADYTYTDQMIYGPNDDARGPRSTIAQIPGLTYDAATHTVVYDSNDRKTVCATVREKSGLLGRHVEIKNTGACTVSTEPAEHAEDDGWSIRRFRTLDIYLNVR